MKSIENINGKITYDKLFWLFMAGAVLGVVIEGFFCLILRGKWESHVVSVLGPFNALYGAGAVLFFSVASLLRKRSMVLKIVTITVIATVLELLCGILLADGLGMKAWDYSNNFLNYRGMICLTFALGWGIAGFVFCLFFEKIDKALSKLQSKKWNIACLVLSVFMVINLSLTAVTIFRWSERHYEVAANTKIGTIIDEFAPDDWMQERFVEWSFLDNEVGNK